MVNPVDGPNFSRVKIIASQQARVEQKNREKAAGTREEIEATEKRRIDQHLASLLATPAPSNCLHDTLLYDPTSLDVFLLAQKIEKEFYDPTVISTMKCILENVIVSSNDNIHYFLSNLRRIGAPSVNGVAMVASLKDAVDIFVLKIPQNIQDNDVNKHELAVGLYGTNALRELVPNFSYVYGGFDCSSPIFEVSGDIVHWCELSAHARYQYVVYENILNSVSLNEYIINGCSKEEFANNYLQILFALDIARKKINFTHYDLHPGNVLIRKLPDVKSLMTSRGALEITTVATIIDYGMAYFETRSLDRVSKDPSAKRVDPGNPGAGASAEKETGYGSPAAVNLDSFFISTTSSNVFHDAYKLLLFSALRAKDSDNQQVFKFCEQVFSFFNKDDKLENSLDPNLYFSVPNVDNFEILDLIDYILSFENPLTVEATSAIISPADQARLADGGGHRPLLEEIRLSIPLDINDMVYQQKTYGTPFPELLKDEILDYLEDAYGVLTTCVEKFNTYISQLTQIERLTRNDFDNNLKIWSEILETLETYFLTLDSLDIFLLYLREENILEEMDITINFSEHNQFFETGKMMRNLQSSVKILLQMQYNIYLGTTNSKEDYELLEKGRKLLGH